LILRILFLSLTLGLIIQNPVSSPARAGVTGDQAVDVVFSEVEKRLVREYFGKDIGAAKSDSDDADGKKGKGKKGGKGGKGKTPPGLAKRDKLPPGLARHVEKHGTLPPGLETRELPPGLESELPSAKGGTERVIVDQDVVLIEQATGKVLDVIIDVIKN